MRNPEGASVMRILVVCGVRRCSGHVNLNALTMGNTVSNVSRYVVRKVRRFNIDNRVYKFLDKKVRFAAPKPKSTIAAIEKIHEEFPNLMDEINKQDPSLNERLKKIYVSSTNVFQEVTQPENPSSCVERGSRDSPDQGEGEPTTVTPGRIALKDAVQLLIKHHSDKSRNTSQKLAEEYKLNVKDTENVLEYCKMFKVLTKEEVDLARADFYLPRDSGGNVVGREVETSGDKK